MLEKYTPRQIEQICVDHSYFLAEKSKYEGKTVIKCSQEVRECKYARNNGIVHCTALQSIEEKVLPHTKPEELLS